MLKTIKFIIIALSPVVIRLWIALWPFTVHLHISQQEHTASNTAWTFFDPGNKVRYLHCRSVTFWDLTYIIPNWSSSMSMTIAQNVQQSSAPGMGTPTDQKQVQKFARSVSKLQFIIHRPHPPSWQLLPLLAFSRLHFSHSSWNSCLLRRLSQPFIPADTGSSFSNLSRSLALTSLSQGVISKRRPASAWWYFLLGC